MRDNAIGDLDDNQCGIESRTYRKGQTKLRGRVSVTGAVCVRMIAAMTVVAAVVWFQVTHFLRVSRVCLWLRVRL